MSLTPQLNKTKLSENVRSNDAIANDCFPGAFSQIVTNLVMNSMSHAYQLGEEGQLCFEVIHQDDRLIIHYTDDGCGISEKTLIKFLNLSLQLLEVVEEVG
ncbi:hypothetical protein WA1_30195 [Scytonema hofmannii PCC 7110]|uniref:Histidine kinase/HSP90-like ATPase domain-containing protein n=1 Tax=Scytonema hofmannii PCC 7110 TaxID=128403 RepID=A0A139X4J3_9CYAN|nr:ATP-binding protein [Scytonema hofmannii]KYC39617.1 hypothetical protein WA1_30195 [Scytonema hofmannii PCC 7110]